MELNDKVQATAAINKDKHVRIITYFFSAKIRKLIWKMLGFIIFNCIDSAFSKNFLTFAK